MWKYDYFLSSWHVWSFLQIIIENVKLVFKIFHPCLASATKTVQYFIFFSLESESMVVFLISLSKNQFDIKTSVLHTLPQDPVSPVTRRAATRMEGKPRQKNPGPSGWELDIGPTTLSRKKKASYWNNKTSVRPSECLKQLRHSACLPFVPQN